MLNKIIAIIKKNFESRSEEFYLAISKEIVATLRQEDGTNYDKAREILQGGTVQVDQAVEYRHRLAGDYAYYSDLLLTIQSRKPDVWNELRSEVKSDAQANKKYEMTTDGNQELWLKSKLKAIEKMMSAFKSQIDLANNEYNNAKHF